MITADLPDLLDVQVGTLSVARFATVLPHDAAATFEADARAAARAFDGRTVWNINSTASGGGVAEMLQSLVPYARGAGVDARWTVIQGDADFFLITKRIHNRLHGSAGDGGELGDDERRHYEAVLEINAQRLLARIRESDIVILHDPQTAGLIPLLRERGLVVLWRCHVGVDAANDMVRSAWDFLRGYVDQASAYVFSCESFVWDGLDPSRLSIIAPSIDPFAVKNYELSPESVEAILHTSALEVNNTPHRATFQRADGSDAEVTRTASLLETAPLEPATQVVLQVSRWDTLKDPAGVLQGFVEHIAPGTSAHLVLAGPAVTHVTDDPEGLQVLEGMRNAWHSLAEPLRQRVHLASLPMEDLEENAVMVNALQRRATVVVQKSLAEGFGLTVAEAMWKGRPVVASRLGGILDQIEDGVSGVLVDPRDLRQYGDAVSGLLNDSAAAEAMGQAAMERVRSEFLGTRHLHQYLETISRLL